MYYEDVEPGDEIPHSTVTVDETQMFFFSAATYNGHRIHYDKQWARDVEGYDDVLVQGPLQSALLARALTDWIGGRGRLVEYSVQNRAVAYPGAGARLRRRGHRQARRRTASGLVDLDDRRPARRHRADAGHRDRRAAPARRDGDLMALRGEAAIVGIAELPAQRKQTRPELFTLDQYAALAAMVDRGRRPRRRRWSTGWSPTASPSRTCSHRPP